MSELTPAAKAMLALYKDQMDELLSSIANHFPGSPVSFSEEIGKVWVQIHTGMAVNTALDALDRVHHDVHHLDVWKRINYTCVFDREPSAADIAADQKGNFTDLAKALQESFEKKPLCLRSFAAARKFMDLAFERHAAVPEMFTRDHEQRVHLHYLHNNTYYELAFVRSFPPYVVAHRDDSWTPIPYAKFYKDLVKG